MVGPYSKFFTYKNARYSREYFNTALSPFSNRQFYSHEQAKRECDWVMMSSVFVASESSCFFLCLREQISPMENWLNALCLPHSLDLICPILYLVIRNTGHIQAFLRQPSRSSCSLQVQVIIRIRLFLALRLAFLDSFNFS